MSEAEVIAIIEGVLKNLARKFVFGYFDEDDIKQEAFIMAMDGLEGYDPGGFNEDGTPKRPLENFMYAHLHNRLCNLKRNKLRRNDPPCRSCASGVPCTDEGICTKYSLWKTRNDLKAAFMEPLSILESDDKPEGEPVVEGLVRSEIFRKIDENLPSYLREDYLRILDRVRVSREKRLAVEKAIRDIFGVTCEEI